MSIRVLVLLSGVLEFAELSVTQSWRHSTTNWGTAGPIRNTWGGTLRNLPKSMETSFDGSKIRSSNEKIGNIVDCLKATWYLAQPALERRHGLCNSFVQPSGNFSWMARYVCCWWSVFWYCIHIKLTSIQWLYLLQQLRLLYCIDIDEADRYVTP